MRTTRPDRPSRSLPALVLRLATLPILTTVGSASLPAAEPGTSTSASTVAIVATPHLAVLDREIALERGEWMCWRIDYLLRNAGTETVVVEPGALSAHVAGWVSNSRADGHAVPRRSDAHASGGSGLCGTSLVIDSEDEARRCQERLVLQAWPAEAGRTPPDPVAKATVRAVEPGELPTLEIAPGAELWARLRLEHEHHLCGTHNALLGERDVELRLGAATIRDVLPLDHQGRVVAPVVNWPPDPPAEFRDDRIFLSAPDCLHLEAHIPGRRSYRFPDYRDVAGGERMHLSFWYLVAPGTDGRCQARITQYRDLPSSFKTLYDGEIVEDLPITGRWARVDRILRAEPDATVMTLDVRITDSDVDVGALWIDDIKLQPFDDLLATP